MSDDPRNPHNLPPAVKHLLDVGASRLWTLRRLQEAEREAEAEAERAAVEADRAAAWEAFSAVVPGDLLPYLEAVRDADPVPADPIVGIPYCARLCCPGCVPVMLRVLLGDGARPMGPVTFRVKPAPGEAAEEFDALPEAVARAREVWLEAEGEAVPEDD